MEERYIRFTALIRLEVRPRAILPRGGGINHERNCVTPTWFETATACSVVSPNSNDEEQPGGAIFPRRGRQLQTTRWAYRRDTQSIRPSGTVRGAGLISVTLHSKRRTACYRTCLRPISIPPSGDADDASRVVRHIPVLSQQAVRGTR